MLLKRQLLTHFLFEIFSTRNIILIKERIVVLTLSTLQNYIYI